MLEVTHPGPGQEAEWRGADARDLLAGLETLVANSSIQFLDVVVDEATAAATTDRYFECVDEEREADGPSLYQVALDENGVFRHPLTDEVADPRTTYAVDGRRALDAYAGGWIPVPYLRAGAARGPGLAKEGPSNWARLCVFKDASDPAAAQYRIVLALDTALDRTTGEQAGLAAPTIEDISAGAVFRFAADIEAVGWFVTEPWVDEWLAEAFREGRQRHRPDDSGSEIPATPREYLAHYLTLLAVLADAAAMPAISLVAASNAERPDPVPVDLVLDIGASRTFALLVEPQAGPNAQAPCDVLALRDLTSPWLIHRGIFSSRIEFARASLGKEVYSRWSGRTNAFYWPSLARVGTEANRLACEQSAADAVTGLSSPMRYLWDDRGSRQVWRFAGSPAGGQRRNTLVSGPLLAHLTETGDVLDAEAGGAPTTKPRFSRSSLATFFAAELVQHALSAINAPAYRWAGGRDGAPRRLARIVVTTPTTLQPAEHAIVRRRIEAALRLVWQAMGWDAVASPALALLKRPARSMASPVLPEVVLTREVATATQLAFLDNEIRQKFQGDARAYLDLIGRQRAGLGLGRSLRIAALDIGGGASSLAITTYGLGDAGRLGATPHLVEGFAVGGDLVLKALIEEVVLPALERRLADSRLPDPKKFLGDIVNGATHGRASRLGEFRRRLAGEIAMPAAVAILREHEILRAASDDRPAVRTLGDLLAASEIDPRPASDELESLASDEGADGFHALDTPVTFSLAELNSVVNRVLAPVVAGAVRAIRALECDVVLLSGWLSRLPAVKETLLAGMPIRPDRIVAMHEHRVGPWFPLRTALGNVGDPKTLAAVGAMLASRPEPRIGGHVLRFAELEPRLPRSFIGRLSNAGLVGEDQVVFESGTDPVSQRPAPPRRATISVEPPLVLAVRRSPLASWPALPLYALDFDEVATEEKPKTPIRVTLEWSIEDETGTARPSIIRATDADGNDLASGEISLRLQTLADPGGHWLDTGVFAIA